MLTSLMLAPTDERFANSSNSGSKASPVNSIDAALHPSDFWARF